jgi:hypothetical protein
MEENTKTYNQMSLLTLGRSTCSAGFRQGEALGYSTCEAPPNFSPSRLEEDGSVFSQFQ